MNCHLLILFLNLCFIFAQDAAKISKLVTLYSLKKIDLNESWTSFKSSHRKFYKNSLEETIRFYYLLQKVFKIIIIN